MRGRKESPSEGMAVCEASGRFQYSKMEQDDAPEWGMGKTGQWEAVQCSKMIVSAEQTKAIRTMQ